MMPRFKPMVAVMACMVTFVSLSAEAESESHRPPVERAGDWRLNLGTGAFVDASGVGGELSVMATFRYRCVEAGGLLEGGSLLFGGGHRLAGAALGGVYQSPAGMRLELLGIAGQDAYSGIDCGLFCRSGGASAAFPWVGGRMGISYVFARDRTRHFELGGAAMLGGDTHRSSVEYSTTSKGLFSGETHTSDHRMVLGGWRSTYLLVLGGVLDWG